MILGAATTLFTFFNILEQIFGARKEKARDGGWKRLKIEADESTMVGECQDGLW